MGETYYRLCFRKSGFFVREEQVWVLALLEGRTTLILTMTQEFTSQRLYLVVQPIKMVAYGMSTYLIN